MQLPNGGAQRLRSEIGYNAAAAHFRRRLFRARRLTGSGTVAPSWTLDIGSHTEVGNVRDHNEDALQVSDDLKLFAVADGMGGHQAGERASYLAIRELYDFIEYRATSGSRDEDLRTAFRTANEAIFRESLAHKERRGMGTTMTALWMLDDDYLIGHVGDSRAWVIRDGVCQQLTHDHSVMGEQLRQGLITAEQALTHPLRNVLTRSLGNMPSVEVDVYQGRAAAGDIFVIGSDGMTRALDEPLIAHSESWPLPTRSPPRPTSCSTPAMRTAPTTSRSSSSAASTDARNPAVLSAATVPFFNSSARSAFFCAIMTFKDLEWQIRIFYESK